MRIEIIEVPLIDDIEIQIRCKEKNEYVNQLAATIIEMGKRIIYLIKVNYFFYSK